MLIERNYIAFRGFLLILLCSVAVIFMGCEEDFEAQYGEQIRETQTQVTGETTLEALDDEIERTPESTVDLGNVTGEPDDSDPAEEIDEASIKQSMEFSNPAWMALGKLNGKDVSGKAGFEGIFVNTPSADGVTDRIVSEIAVVTYITGAILPYSKGEQPPTVEIPKYSPALRSKLENGNPDELIDIVVNLRDDLDLSPLPRFKDAKRGSDEWKQINAVRQVEIQKIKDARKGQFDEFRELLRGKIKFETVYVPWIANTPIITVALDSVKVLAELDHVINISLNEEAVIAQGPDGDAANDMLDVRQQLRTTPYESLNLDWGVLAVIDSGIRLTHDMVDDQVGDYSGDCFNGGDTCWGDGSSPNGAPGTNFPNYNVTDFAMNNNGHGTPIKAGISGSDDISSELRGITRVTTDVWKVSPLPNPATPNAEENSTPYLGTSRAIQKAIVEGSLISNHSYGGFGSNSMNPDFDNAYDLGMGVFTSSGNSACSAGNFQAPPSNVGWNDFACDDNVTRTPGIANDENGVQMVEPAFGGVGGGAHKAIAVGAHEIDPPCNSNGVSSDICSYSDRGPTPDGRYKPDILGYTNWETGRANNDTATGSFGGTSAASPSIAAMAQIYNNFLELASNFASWLSPGHVYAAVLGSGENQTFWEGSYDYIGVEPNISTLNIEGVGRPKMFVNGSLSFGTAQLNNTGDIVTVNLDVPEGACGIQSAIWWPEGSDQGHNDIDIHLVNPDGVTFAAGQSGKSVWERASIKTDDGLTKGIYKARILGFDVKQSQQVFYSIHVQNTECWDG